MPAIASGAAAAIAGGAGTAIASAIAAAEAALDEAAVELDGVYNRMAVHGSTALQMNAGGANSQPPRLIIGNAFSVLL